MEKEYRDQPHITERNKIKCTFVEVKVCKEELERKKRHQEFETSLYSFPRGRRSSLYIHRLLHELLPPPKNSHPGENKERKRTRICYFQFRNTAPRTHIKSRGERGNRKIWRAN